MRSLALLISVLATYAGAISGGDYRSMSASTLASALTEIPKLAPLEQIARLKVLAQSDAGARAVTAVVLDPSLLETRRADVENAVGADKVAAVAALAANLQVEARANAQVLAALQAAPEEAAPAALEARFDGRADTPAVDLSRLTPALVVPTSEAPRSVYAVTANGDRFLINGKEAKPLRERRVDGALVSHALVHPDNPDVLVKIYYSAGSMDAYEKKADKVSRLEPLSRAGAAPLLIEHGEASVQGLGRVYFYTQQLLKGRNLGERGADVGIVPKVEKLFERLAKSGLAMQIPGSDPSWLLRHIMFGKDAQGEETAYVVGALGVSADEASVAAVTAMLRSMLPSDLGQRALPTPEPEQLAPKTPLADKLTSFEDGGPTELVLDRAPKASLDDILARHDLAGYKRDASRINLPDEDTLVAVLPGLLADRKVTGVHVSKGIKQLIDRRSARGLLPLLKAMPEGAERDALLLKISGSVYAVTEGSAITSLLELVNVKEQLEFFRTKTPVEAWRRLSWTDAERLSRRLIARNAAWGAFGVIEQWLRANREEQIAGKPGLQEVAELLKSVPDSAARDELLLELPVGAYEDLRSAAIAAWIVLGRSGGANFVSRLPDQAWQGLNAADAETLIKHWNAIGSGAAAAEGLRRWLDAHPDVAGRPDEILAWLASGTARDNLITSVRTSTLKAISGEQAARLLALVQRDANAPALYQKLSPEVWKTLDLDDAKKLVRHWTTEGFPQVATVVIQRWLEVHAAAVGTKLSALEGVVELIGILPEGAPRDEALFKIPASAYLDSSSEAVGNLLALVSKASEQTAGGGFSKFPSAAWSALVLPDLTRLVKHLQALGLHASTAWIIESWLRLNDEKKRGGLKLPDFISFVTEFSWRDWLIASLRPPLYAAASPEEVLQALALLHANDSTIQINYDKLAPIVWRQLGLAEIERLLKALTGKQMSGSAGSAARLWLKSNDSGDTKLAAIKALLVLAGDGVTRNAAVLAIPKTVYADAPGSEVASVLLLLNKNAEPTVGAAFDLVPAEAWKGMSAADLAPLVRAWIGHNNAHNAAHIVVTWAKAVGATWEQALPVIKLLPENFRGWTYTQAWQTLNREASAAELAKRLPLVPTTGDRDRLILDLKPAVYEKASPEDVATILSLLSKESENVPGTAWNQIPTTALERLDAEGLDRLILHRISLQQAPSAAVLFTRWATLRAADLGSDQLPWKTIRQALLRFGDVATRDELLKKLPGFASHPNIEQAHLASEDFGALLKMATIAGRQKGPGEVYDAVSVAAWRLLSYEDLTSVAIHWAATNHTPTMVYFLHAWMQANADRLIAQKGAGLVDLVKTLPEAAERDRLLMTIPPSIYAASDGAVVGALLTLVSATAENSNTPTLPKIPVEAWRALRLRDAERLARRWPAESPIRGRVHALWLDAHRPAQGASQVAGKDLYESLKALPESAARDEMILALTGYGFASLSGRDSALLLTLLSQDGAVKGKLYEKLPEEAWVRMVRPEVDTVTARWLTDPHTQPVAQTILKLWLASQN